MDVAVGKIIEVVIVCGTMLVIVRWMIELVREVVK